MSLIHRLNQMVKLTPDEITARLKCKGWVQGKDMTRAIIKEWGGDRIHICYKMSNGTWNLNTFGTYTANSFGLHGFKVNLADHYFILQENYNGQFPDL